MAWHRHDWTPWGLPFDSIEVRPTGHFGETVEIKVVVQYRTCLHCLLIESRVIREGSVMDEIKGPNK